MAKLNGPLSFTGALAGLSAYERLDMDGTILRAPSSLTKQRIHSDPAFINTRREAAEGGGRSTAATMLRRILYPLDPVRVGNWQAPLTGALTPVQYRDGEGLYGQRSLLFSRYGNLLDGLCLSRRTPFEQVLRNPVSFILSKEDLRAEVSVPALTQGVNLFAPPGQLYVRVVVVLGAVPDLRYTPYGYQPYGDYSQLFSSAVYSEWYTVKGGAPAITLSLQLTQTPPNEAFGLLLATGVLFGTVNQWGRLEAVRHAGSGRIMAVR